MEAREAADRLFAELPSTASTISLGDMANHLQEVMFVPWAEVIAHLHVPCVRFFAREEAESIYCPGLLSVPFAPPRPVARLGPCRVQGRERERERERKRKRRGEGEKFIDNQQVTKGR